MIGEEERGGELVGQLTFATHPIHFFFSAFFDFDSVAQRQISSRTVCVCVRVCVCECMCVFKGILSMSKPDATSQRQTTKKE